MPVQGNVRRVFLRKQKYSKLVFTAISGSIVDRLGFLRAVALKRHLEDRRGFRGRKKLLVARVSSFP